MKVAIFVGHSLLTNGSYTSASGYKNEYLVNKDLSKKIQYWLKQAGIDSDVIICPEKKFKSAKEESTYKLPIANSGKYNLVVELHCNAYKTVSKEMGAEVLYSSSKGKEVAERVQNQLKTVFTDRGVKHRDNLYILTKTKSVSIIVETFFIDSKADCDIYDKQGPDKIAKLIAQGIVGKTIANPSSSTTTTTKPSSTTGKYRVVVGSYADKSNAEATRDKLKKAGFDSFLVFQEGI